MEVAGERLRRCIADESERLLRTFYTYVLRMGLATPETARGTASELLNEVVVEALEHAQRFDLTRQPLAWLLGIGANLIRRKQAELAKLNRREPLARDLYEDQTLSEDEMFDRLAALAVISGDTPHSAEVNAEVSALLGALPPGDQRVLRLAILHDLDGDELARELGISAGAARVRLHRAIRRLRAAIQAEDKFHETYQ